MKDQLGTFHWKPIEKKARHKFGVWEGRSSAKHSAHMARVHALCSHSMETHSNGKSSLEMAHTEHMSKIQLSIQSETVLFTGNKMDPAVSCRMVVSMRYILI